MAAQIKYNIPVSITKQGRRFVAYTPVLDLSTSGKTVREVQRNFSEAVNLFLEEIIAAHTVDDVLSELGWEKVQQRWAPPRVVLSESMGVRIPALV